uniref:HCR2 n=1 Tax=Alvikia littoralis TaxID=56200 RepID=O22113_ALVLI|nr:HCR2 [Alvikia littoralis]
MSAWTRRLRNPAVVLTATILLWLVLIISGACFGIVTFGYVTKFWDLPGHSAARDAFDIAFPDAPSPEETSGRRRRSVELVSGRDFYLFVTVFLSSMVAAIAGSFLAWIRHHLPANDSHTHGKPEAKKNSLAAKLTAYMHRALFFQLPPRRMWYWWCGGLHPLNTFIYAVFMGYIFVYLYQHVDAFTRNAERYAMPPLPPGATRDEEEEYRSALRIAGMQMTFRNISASGKILGEFICPMWMLLFYPVSRSNFLKWAFAQDFSTIVKYHRWLGYLTIYTTFAHSLLYYIAWGAEGEFAEQVIVWTRPGCGNRTNHVCNYLAGSIATWVSIIILATSHAWFRKNYYKIFYRVHIAGFILFTIFSFMHYTGLMFWVVPGMVLYALDRTFRGYQVTNICHVPSSDIRAVDGVVSIKLRWARDTYVSPGSTVWLRCPAITKLDAHPFSVAEVQEQCDDSSGGGPSCIVHMRASGPWTKALAALSKDGGDITMQVEGPYDTSCACPPTGEAVVFLGGGLGVTPLLSMLHAMRDRRKAGLDTAEDQIVYMSWTCRAIGELLVMDGSLLQAASTAEGDKIKEAAHVEELPGQGKWLDLSVHYTGLEDVNGAEKNTEISDTFAPKIPQALNDHSLKSNPANNPIIFSISAVLSFWGAFAGAVAVNHYQGVRILDEDGEPDSSNVGALQVFCMAVGAMLAPLAFLLLLTAWRMTAHWLRHRNSNPSRRSSSSLDSASLEASRPLAPAALPMGTRTMRMLPGYRLACSVDGPWAGRSCSCRCHAAGLMPEPCSVVCAPFMPTCLRCMCMWEARRQCGTMLWRFAIR